MRRLALLVAAAGAKDGDKVGVQEGASLGGSGSVGSVGSEGRDASSRVVFPAESVGKFVLSDGTCGDTVHRRLLAAAVVDLGIDGDILVSLSTEEVSSLNTFARGTGGAGGSSDTDGSSGPSDSGVSGVSDGSGGSGDSGVPIANGTTTSDVSPTPPLCCVERLVALANLLRKDPAGAPTLRQHLSSFPAVGYGGSDGDSVVDGGQCEVQNASTADTAGGMVVVLGNTGAGKSTLLNALLGESAVLPTNCMRACTATVVEVAFQERATEDAVYAADIFITDETQWRRELQTLCQALGVGSSGGAGEASGVPGAAEASARLRPRRPRRRFHRHRAVGAVG